MSIRIYNSVAICFKIYTAVLIRYFPEIQIELDIFSGVSNPSWTLTNASPDFETVKTALIGASGSALASVLAYRGFVVKTVFTSGATVTQTFGKGGQSSTSLETALLNSNSANLDSDIVSIAQAGIAGTVNITALFQRHSHHNWAASREKCIFGIFDRVRFKPVCSATETS